MPKFRALFRAFLEDYVTNVIIKKKSVALITVIIGL